MSASGTIPTYFNITLKLLKDLKKHITGTIPTYFNITLKQLRAFLLSYSGTIPTYFNITLKPFTILRQVAKKYNTYLF